MIDNLLVEPVAPVEPTSKVQDMVGDLPEGAVHITVFDNVRCYNVAIPDNVAPAKKIANKNMRRTKIYIQNDPGNAGTIVLGTITDGVADIVAGAATNGIVLPQTAGQNLFVDRGPGCWTGEWYAMPATNAVYNVHVREEFRENPVA